MLWLKSSSVKVPEPSQQIEFTRLVILTGYVGYLNSSHCSARNLAQKVRESRVACRGLIRSFNAGLVFLEVLGSLRHAIPIETLLVHETSADLHGFDPGRALDHALVPCLNVCKSLKLVVVRNSKRCIQPIIPGNESKVSKSHAVPDQPLLVFGLSSEDPVQDAQYPFDLVRVTLNSRRNLFRVQVCEP